MSDSLDDLYPALGRRRFFRPSSGEQALSLIIRHMRECDFRHADNKKSLVDLGTKIDSVLCAAESFKAMREDLARGIVEDKERQWRKKLISRMVQAVVVTLATAAAAVTLLQGMSVIHVHLG